MLEDGAPGVAGAEEGNPLRKRLPGMDIVLSIRLGLSIGVRECIRVGTEAMVLGAWEGCGDGDGLELRC